MGKLILKISKPSMNNLKVGARKSKGIGDLRATVYRMLF